MKPTQPEQVRKLEDLPNIGKSIAADLRSLGIRQPRELAGLEPLAVYRRLAGVMGERHDPCVLYTLMAVRHFFDSGEARPWWQFAAEGRRLLQVEAAPRPGRRPGRA
jgi:DNA transformation protein